MKYKWINPYYTIIESYLLETGQIILNGEVIQTYPTSDGGYWYMDKGRVVIIND